MIERIPLRELAFAAVFCSVAVAAAPPITVRSLSYADVEALPGVAALEVLVNVPPSERPSAWDRWVRQRTAEIQDRLLRGEEDSLAYLLVFGTSYTSAPRVTREFLEQAAGGAASPSAAPTAALQKAFNTRMTDCLRALASPGSDERLGWAAATMARMGYRLDTSDGIAKATEYMLRNLSRVLRESTELSQTLAAAQGGDRETEAAVRARIFSQRGLAPDTSWPINFALADTLRQLAGATIIARGTVARVAIVGPGLDFVDKNEGYDYYPPQSLQPFAVIDAVRASGLAGAGQPAVTTFDISSRVNVHLNRLISPAGRRPYDLQLVRDRQINWTAGATRYWNEFGNAIGTAISPMAPPASAGPVDSRAIRLSADVIGRVRPIEANIVYQRIDAAAADRFDLVIATNILLYYDSFEQMLAANNIVRLLAPGGLFLTNTRLDDVRGFPMTRASSVATAFSNRPGDGEYVYVYRNAR